MEIKRICKNCGKAFCAIKTNQFFCCRNCFKKNYYIENRIRIEGSEQRPRFPKKHCDFCGIKTQLDFDPTKDRARFSNWPCPNCGVTNELLWKYEGSDDWRNEIKIILRQREIDFPKKEVILNVQKYHIPIRRPEECSSTILTMACVTIDTMSVKKLKRRKLTFS